MKIVFRCPPDLEDILPQPIPARRGAPDWLKNMPMSAYSDDLGKDVDTFKHCAPFIDAMSHGFLIPLPTDITVDRMTFSWDWPVDAAGPDGLAYNVSPIGYHAPAQAADSPLFDKDAAFIKFSGFWTVELEPGWSLYVIHPANRVDLPFRTVSGMVDADLYSDNFINFPAIWTDRAFSGVLKKGTPIAQCIPVLRQRLDFEFETLQGEAAERFTRLKRDIVENPHVYKNKIRARRP